MYLDSAYIAKYYVNETDSAAVRSLVARPEPLVPSAVCMAEVTCAFHRHSREGRITLKKAGDLTMEFLKDVDSKLWTLVPISDKLLHRVAFQVSGAPATLFVRAADALHLITAQDQGETEIWTNDRHLLAAAPHFGIAGRSV